MNYKKLNIDWNADPNAPEPYLSVSGKQVSLRFYLNPFLFDQIEKDGEGELIFLNCHKYSFNNCNDEGYLHGQYRYSNEQPPWGEFYLLQTDWKYDFPMECTILEEKFSEDQMKHFIFFFRDNTFECVAEDYVFSYLNKTIP
ncbi:hypothetical protein [Pontibacter ruber]|uniref:Uncharacterized protein n=1 Tax=Pontibacter ruber TaxID=1343895 RepID=A0ABW5CZM0_9BACT|nr:hypothetical protein [Pontibacter ruber]